MSYRSRVGRSTLARQLYTVLIGIVVMLVVAWVDWITGPNLHLGFLYLIPVALAAWFSGRLPGYLLIIFATILWRRLSEPASDFQAGTPILILNLFAHLVYYPAVVEVVLRLRTEERRLERQVGERTIELRGEIIERERAEQSLRKLGAQLSEAEDNERKRVAYDIHDALSQSLSVVKLNLEAAVAESSVDSRQFERLTVLVKVVDDLIRQTREMTFDLHPSMLDDLGLIPTLKGFADEFHRRTMAEVIVNEAGERKNVPSALASYLFRAIKEVVNNAVKHGNAHEIVVAVFWTDSGIRIVVDDDGSGFDTTTALLPHARRGLGLRGIDERLTSLGGTLRLESEPGQGARIILETPLPKQ